jgi:hypothetical protein
LKTTTQKLQIILGSHIHVPYGAGDEEFERACCLRLKPFVSALYRFPQIQGTLHYSGSLLTWVDRVYPECTMSIDQMVSRKQVELLGGGFYEPQFSFIPLQDKIGQVEMLTTYLRKRFGKKPQGCWLPALSWEQNLVGPLSSCGMLYTFLEEDQFRKAGLLGEDLYTPCLSEDQGKLISVFPVSRSLGDLFAPGKEEAALFLNALKKLSAQLPDSGSRVVSVFPDPCRAIQSEGEAELYWRRFFQGLSDSLTLFDFTTPGRFIKGKGGFRKAYFPGSSDHQYLADFPAANGIYAKMIFSRTLINQLRGDKSRKRTALEELWKAQGYDAFRPAESGGIYRGDLRKSAYRSLLEAEKITRETGAFIPCLLNFDFDLDNQDEYLFQGERINCYIHQEGASVFELDYLPRSWNYLDTFVRHRSGKSEKSEKFEKSGNPGNQENQENPGKPGACLCRGSSFSDLIIPAPDTAEFPPPFPAEGRNLKELLGGREKEIRYCGDERFQEVDMDKTRGKVCFVLPETERGPFRSIRVEKTYQLRKDTLSVTYTLINRGEGEERFFFTPVLTLSFPGEGDAYQRIFVNGAALPAGKARGRDTPSAITGVDTLKFQDLKNETIISLGATKPFDGWVCPVYYRIPGGADSPAQDSYQSTCIVPLFTTRLSPEESQTFTVSLKFAH